MKNLRGSALIYFVLLFLLVFLTACAEGTVSDSESAESEEGTQEEGANAGEEEDVDVTTGEGTPVTIGYSGPLSGPAAYYGENTLSGLELAAKEINEEGGFEIDGEKYEIDLKVLDDQYLPDETGSNAKRLVQEDDASIIYSPHSGGIYAMQVFNEDMDFLIAAYTSEPGVTDNDNSLTMRIPPRYDGYIEPFTEYEMDRFGDKIAFLPTSTQYGKDWAEMLKPVWEEKGGEIVYETSIDFNKETDFFTILSNALQNDPDVMFVGGPSEPTAKVIKQAREQGFEGGFIVMDQAKLDEMAAVYDGEYDIFEGSVGVLPLRESDFPGTDQFIETYQSEYDKMPGSEAGFHYVSLYILVEAMKAAGTVEDTGAIRDHIEDGIHALPEEKQVYTIGGIDDWGGFTSEYRLGVVEDGTVEEIVIEE
ncbi:ABC transporter substrate-binding protein [Alteribacillus sp. JSM 102045]|uniref:ABC transporter substrate-binding protein n=1 Tax=Alteribacillus sp. JSM 102045 TaxID=1562101 RepID=UPI0035BEEA3F